MDLQGDTDIVSCLIHYFYCIYVPYATHINLVSQDERDRVSRRQTVDE